MLTEFDQSTIANITAALDFVCRKIPADKDTNELRKRIADELVRCARARRCTLIELEQEGMKIIKEVTKPAKFSWLGWWRP
jgi:ketopantoate reductase